MLKPALRRSSVAAWVTCYCFIIVGDVIVLGALFLLFVLFNLNVIEYVLVQSKLKIKREEKKSNISTWSRILDDVPIDIQPQ